MSDHYFQPNAGGQDDDPDCDAKVEAIFRELVGARASRLRASFFNTKAEAATAQALSATSDGHQSSKEKVARDIAFHLVDWNSDAAFIVALQLFPERFTAEEIADGVERFVIHAPNHIAAAVKLAGYPIEDIFKVGALDGLIEEPE